VNTPSGPTADRTYHTVEFDRRIEAAAFVAALSRFLASPRGGSPPERPEPVEVWSHAYSERATIDLHLSDGALHAAMAVFFPVPVAHRGRGDELPADCTLVVGGPGGPALAVEDALKRFESN
jgi:hypothetical protein